MNLIVPVSAAERQQGRLRPESERAALAILRDQGCVVLRGAFAPEIVDALAAAFGTIYGKLDAAAMKQIASRPPPNPFLEVGVGRFEIAVPMHGLFAQPELFANPLLRRFLEPLLGSDMRLSGFTAVVSFPGSPAQDAHRDHAYLYGADDPRRDLPVHAINCAVPLIDVDAQTGPTAIWPGSHKWPEDAAVPAGPPTVVPFVRGDCVLVDYRTLHAGLANRGRSVRPILYMVYARTWFFDEVNHVGRTALDMPLETFAGLPPDVKPLLQRVFSQAMRARMAR